MTKDELLKLCRAEARRRHPGCDPHAEVERPADAVKGPRPAWIAGCPGGGWVATLTVHGASGKVIARHEARAPTSGRAAAALADAMGVAWRAETEEAKR